MKRWTINAITFVLCLLLVFVIGSTIGIALGFGGEQKESYTLSATVTEQGYGAIGSTTVQTEKFIRTFATFDKSYQKGTEMVVTITEKQYPIFGTFYYYSLEEVSSILVTCL